MDRRGFLRTIASGAASAAMAGCAGTKHGSSADRPNIILFITDDHGWQDAGCYGNDMVRTPNLDRLARESLRFTHAFAGSPTCSPSRSVMYTGLMPLRNGAHPNHAVVKKGIKTLPHYMKELGYRVVLAGKTHIQPREAFPFEYIDAAMPTDPRWERYYRQEALDTEAVDTLLADHAVNHIDTPLCLVIAAWAPHVVWRFKDHDPADTIVPPYMVDTPLTREALARYYTDIALMDKRLGACLASVRKHGFEENTMFLYTSDQGAQFPHAKWTLYDAGVHTPLLVRWAGAVKPGSVTDAMVGLVDLLPTFIEAAGGTPPPHLDGRSLMAVFSGKAAEHRHELFATHTGDGQMNDFPCRCIRTRTHKYIVNLKPENVYTTHISKGRVRDGRDYWESWIEKAKTDDRAARIVRNDMHRPAEELYDLRNDPYELNNVAAEPANAALLASLREKVKTWMELQGDKGIHNPAVEID